MSAPLGAAHAVQSGRCRPEGAQRTFLFCYPPLPRWANHLRLRRSARLPLRTPAEDELLRSHCCEPDAWAADTTRSKMRLGRLVVCRPQLLPKTSFCGALVVAADNLLPKIVLGVGSGLRRTANARRRIPASHRSAWRGR